MISKQRGIIDPWTLGFLISLTGLTIVQPWEKENKGISQFSSKEQKSSVIMNNQNTTQYK